MCIMLVSVHGSKNDVYSLGSVLCRTSYGVFSEFLVISIVAVKRDFAKLFSVKQEINI